MVYAWKEGSRVPGNIDAGAVAYELAAIGDGEASPEQIVAYAEDKESELHGCFEWSNKKAAYQHRLQQARYVANGIVMFEEPDGEDEEPESVVRAFESVTIPETGERAYVPIEAVMSNDQWRDEVFGQITAGILSLEKKAEGYEHMFPEMAPIAAGLKKVRASI